jgi:hypothetical protein
MTTTEVVTYSKPKLRALSQKIWGFNALCQSSWLIWHLKFSRLILISITPNAPLGEQFLALVKIGGRFERA